MLGNCEVAIEDRPEPAPAEGEVLVKIEVSALCGSEFSTYRADKPYDGNGGHEAVGVVMDPNGSTQFKAGDRVGIYAPYGCARSDCEYCNRGMDSLCPNHGNTNQLHAELAAVNERCLLPLPDDVAFDAGVLLSGDGLGVPYHVSRRLMPTPGDRVCVFGCGPIGLGNVLVQRYYGAEVIAVDIVPKRLELARELGAAHTVDASSADPVAAVKNLTNGKKTEGVIVATGAAAAFDTGMQCVGKQGKLMVVGGIREAAIYPTRDMWGDATLMFSFYYFRSEFPEMVALYRAGLPITKLITHTFPLDRIQEAFDLFAAGLTGKVLMVR